MLNNEKFLNIVSNNLIYYRKKAGLTQLELAEKLNYSDKTISKWERKESLPDVYILYKLCDFYNITLNDLIYKKKDLNSINTKKEKTLVLISFVGLVWLCATFLFITMLVFLESIPYKWLIFIYAIPVSFILFTVFSVLHKLRVQLFYAVSGLIVTSIISLTLTLDLLLSIKNIWFLVILIVPLVAMTLFWFLLKKERHKS